MNKRTISKGVLTVAQLYPNEMNVYGDWGNVLTLLRRIQWHGYTPKIVYHLPGKPFPGKADIFIGGGGQDSGQSVVESDLLDHGQTLRDLSEDGAPMLMICGLYQLFGHSFTKSDGHRIEGIGVFDIETIAGQRRMIGNIVTESEIFGEIIGYENHSGATRLLGAQKALAVVKKGAGNNGEDKLEGAVSGNALGTYLHGSLLPKNPEIADYLIEVAAMRKFGHFEPEIIDDHFAAAARRTARKRPR